MSVRLIKLAVALLLLERYGLVDRVLDRVAELRAQVSDRELDPLNPPTDIVSLIILGSLCSEHVLRKVDSCWLLPLVKFIRGRSSGKGNVKPDEHRDELIERIISELKELKLHLKPLPDSYLTPEFDKLIKDLMTLRKKMKHIPVRTCVICRAKFMRPELEVLGKVNGRRQYICKACIERLCEKLVRGEEESLVRKFKGLTLKAIMKICNRE